MAGLKQIMEIFMTINQPLSSEQRVRWYLQREYTHIQDHFTMRKVVLICLIPLPLNFSLSNSQKLHRF